MTVQDVIVQKIGELKFIAGPITENAHLYRDLGLDSLTFVCLLMTIEESFSIRFQIMEMEQCLRLPNLVALVEKKLAACGSLP